MPNGGELLHIFSKMSLHMMIRLALRVTFKKSKGNLEVSKWLPSYKQKGTILGSRLHDPDNFSQQHKKYWENLASSFKKFLAHVCYSKWIIDAEIYYTAKLCKAQSKQNRPSISLLYTEVPTK